MTASTGRDAWTHVGMPTASVYYELTTPAVGEAAARDPALDPAANDFRAVNFGVKAIQGRLNVLGYRDEAGRSLDVDGWFGGHTRAAVIRAQHGLGFRLNTEGGYYTPGRVGHDLAAALWRRLVLIAEAGWDIPAHHLGGILSIESSADPGAVGQTTPGDKGLMQVNTAVYTYPLADVFDPGWAISWAAQRLHQARLRYADKGTDLQTSASIASHNSPAAASRWFADGRPPNDEIAAYVRICLRYSATY